MQSPNPKPQPATLGDIVYSKVKRDPKSNRSNPLKRFSAWGFEMPGLLRLPPLKLLIFGGVASDGVLGFEGLVFRVSGSGLCWGLGLVFSV